MSRQHALIRRQGVNEYYLVDLGSANGTYLNSRVVVGSMLLKNRDVIRIGQTTMRFELIEEEAAEEKTPERNTDETVVSVRMAPTVILVCDIRNFTRIGEALPPDQLSKFIGSWFREVSEAIHATEGIVDKFIGDAVMAYWFLDPENPARAQRNAVTAAFELHRLSQKVELPRLPNFSFAIGVGISQGIVSLGNVGTKSQRDSTIMGDAVTTAFRLESLSKERKVPIVVSDEIYEELGSQLHFIPLGAVSLKGKTSCQKVYGLALQP